MTEEESFRSPNITLGAAIVMTCISSVYVLCALSGAYDYQPVLVTTWLVIMYLAVPPSMWLEVTKKKKKINEQWTRYIQATQLVVVCTLLIASYLLLL